MATKNSFKLLPQPIITISKIFGTFPIDPETFTFSKIHLLNTLCQALFPIFQMSSYVMLIPNTHLITSPYTFVVQMLFHCVISVANCGTKYVCTLAFKKYLKAVYLEMKASDTFLRTAYNFNADRSIFLLSVYALVALGAIMLPVYSLRLAVLMQNKVNLKKVIFFILMYWQNLTVCCMELQFVFLAINLYYQFQQINLVLRDILARIDDIKYSHLRNALSPKEFYDLPQEDRPEFPSSGVRACNEKYSQDMKQMMARYHFYDISDAHRILRKSRGGCHVYGATDFSLEILNLREAHMHLSEALYLLNKLYSIQLFLTLCLCFCCTLLDINYEIFGYFAGRMGKLKFAVVLWVLGYSLRFAMVVIVANRTCLVAKYAGTLVTSMANRFLDDDTKEELMLFCKHVLSHEFEFTACGFFALNMGLVTSAIATGTTYLVILLQFQP